MNLRGEDGIMWGECLEDFSPLTYYKCTTELMFYTLAGRKSTLVKENIVPIPDLHYAIYSPAEKRYYYKEFRGWDLDSFYYYRPTLTFSGDDPAMEGLRNKIWDGNVWMLLNAEQLEGMQKMVQRVADAHLRKKGSKLKYSKFLRILELSLRIEDYTTYYKNGMGFHTQINIWNTEINEIWKTAI